jgi:hypothetical protein
MKGFAIPGAIEAEDLKDTAVASGGGVWAQDMGQWEYGEAWSRRGALFWHADGPGSELTLQLPCPAAGRYEVVARLAAGPGLGTARFLVGPQAFGDPVNLYAAVMTPREISLGVVALPAGKVPFTVQVTGRDPRARGFDLAIDAFILRPAP